MNWMSADNTALTGLANWKFRREDNLSNLSNKRGCGGSERAVPG
jgi:hypothetical protein